jgi:hypothetical protein
MICKVGPGSVNAQKRLRDGSGTYSLKGLAVMPLQGAPVEARYCCGLRSSSPGLGLSLHSCLIPWSCPPSLVFLWISHCWRVAASQFGPCSHQPLGEEGWSASLGSLAQDSTALRRDQGQEGSDIISYPERGWGPRCARPSLWGC